MAGERYRQDFSWTRELVKLCVIGLAALSCLLLLVSYPSLENILFSVALIGLLSWLCERKSVVERLPMRNKAVLVTGCDTGFGHLLAVSLADQGSTVYAGCLNEHGPGATKLRDQYPDRLFVVQMDVTKLEQVQAVYEDVVSAKTGLWAIVNNAGLNFVGDIDLTTMGQFELVNNINYLGMVRVTKTFLPLVQQAKGRIVNVTSVKGRFSETFNAAYGATKFAGEAFSDILRLEMYKFGVGVSIIEPCNFGGATDCCDMDRISKDFNTMWDNMSSDQQSLYGREYIDHHIKVMASAKDSASYNLRLVIEAMEDALFNLKPKTRYLIPGGSGKYDIYRWRTYAQPFLSDRMMDRWLLRDIVAFPALPGNKKHD